MDQEPEKNGRSRGRPRYICQLKAFQSHNFALQHHGEGNVFLRLHLQNPRLYWGRKKHYVSLNTTVMGNPQWANHLNEKDM